MEENRKTELTGARTEEIMRRIFIIAFGSIDAYRSNNEYWKRLMFGTFSGFVTTAKRKYVRECEYGPRWVGIFRTVFEYLISSRINVVLSV